MWVQAWLPILRRTSDMKTVRNIHVNTLILGAGMAGLGAGIQAQRNNVDSLILEIDDRPGGLCRNSTVAGCDFDFGPKVLILDESDNSKDLLSFLGTNYAKYDLVESTYLKDFGFVGFPIQRNLIDLPPEERFSIIESIKAETKVENEVKSYKDWLIANYGEYLSNMVLIPYEEKKWQTDLASLDYKWALTRPVKVSLEEVIKGSQEKLLPNRVYYYPRIGNISTLTGAMAKQAGNIKYDSVIERIDLKNRHLLANGKTYNYENLISTIPLDSCMAVSEGLEDLFKLEADSMLKRLSIRVFNLVFKGDFELEGSAIYFPDKEFIFRRVSVLQNLCPALARPGLTPISIEVSLKGDGEFKSESEQYDEILLQLSNIAQFKKLGSPVSYEVINIPFAYPVQKDGIREFVEKVHKEYAKFNVIHCGRGGGFDYCNSDTAYFQGKNSMNEVLKI